MPPHLRVFAGTSPDTLVPITSIVNTGKKHRLSSELFDGEIVANIKGFVGQDGTARDSPYFHQEERQGITWSIQIQGRFLVPYTADDILFGNTFDRPLKLPWGSGAALKFMNFVDPTLEHDLTSTSKPWALSPLVSTMPHFAHTRLSESAEDGLPAVAPQFPPIHPIADNTAHIHLALSSEGSSDSASSSGSSTSSVSSNASTSNSQRSSATSLSLKLGLESASRLKGALKVGKRRREKQAAAGLSLQNARQRQSYFSSPERRQAVVFGPKDIITADFCYGFLEFNPSLALRLPGGLSFDLMKYWDGQPVRFVCCERRNPADVPKEGEDPWGRVFWYVTIEMADYEEEDDKSLEGDSDSGVD